jgi:thymidylate kinase
MIVLEGPDGSGKTTLGQQLLSEGIIQGLLPSPSRNTEGRPTVLGRPYVKQVYQYLSRYTSLDVAVDRFFYSELVYGPLQRGCTPFSSEELREVAIAIHKDHLLIYCCPPFVKIAAKSDDPGDREFARRIYETYRSLFFGTPLRFMVYDWTDPTNYPELKLQLCAIKEKNSSWSGLLARSGQMN